MFENEKQYFTCNPEDEKAKRQFAKPQKAAFVVGIILVLFCVIRIGLLIPISSQPSNDTVIECAKQVPAKNLKSQATAIYSDEKVLDNDNYSRYLICMNIEAQNSFGGYVRYKVYVVLQKVNTDKTFEYYPEVAVQYINYDNNFLSDTIIEQIKSDNDWGTQKN